MDTLVDTRLHIWGSLSVDAARLRMNKHYEKH
jgi:hypothetical protein